MMKKSFLAAMALSSSMAVGTAANAQVTIDVTAVQAACATSAAACTAVINQAVAQLRAAGLAPAQLNEAIAAVTGAAISASQSLPAAERAAIAPALTEAASLSTDPEQQAAIQTAAAQIAEEEPTTVTPVAETASPT